MDNPKIKSVSVEFPSLPLQNIVNSSLMDNFPPIIPKFDDSASKTVGELKKLNETNNKINEAFTKIQLEVSNLKEKYAQIESKHRYDWIKEVAIGIGAALAGAVFSRIIG
ncbi:MAG: hypothetical protein ABF449_10835 [Ethanoligenens sp.]